jgi:hypothetical protein
VGALGTKLRNQGILWKDGHVLLPASKLDCPLPEGESPRFSEMFGQVEGHYNKTSQGTWMHKASNKWEHLFPFPNWL